MPQKPKVKEETSVGIDFGVKTFLTLSNEEKIESPQYFKQSQDKLAKHQQELEKLSVHESPEVYKLKNNNNQRGTTPYWEEAVGKCNRTVREHG